MLALGADERNADGMAEHLVSANLCGVDTHGVFNLPMYAGNIRDGEIVPTAWPEIVKETAVSALVRGNWTFGQVAAKFAVEVAIEKAQSQNVAVVSLIEAHHIGRLGHFTEMAAQEGLIAMLWASGYAEENPIATPFGGRKPVMSTNPISIALPTGEGPTILVDFATTATSGSKVMIARKEGKEVPPGCLVDKDGNPTTDPEAPLKGGHFLPFGGHKGYAIMLAAEVLGRIFSGADTLADTKYGGLYMRHQGVTMIVFKADLFQPIEDFTRRVNDMQQRVWAIPPAKGFEEVLVPGDIEARTRAKRQRDGIAIGDEIWEPIVKLAKSLGITDI